MRSHLFLDQNFLIVKVNHILLEAHNISLDNLLLLSKVIPFQLLKLNFILVKNQLNLKLINQQISLLTLPITINFNPIIIIGLLID